jgi:hypothetical protein
MAEHRAGRRGWARSEIAAVVGVALFCAALVCAGAQAFASWRVGLAVGVALCWPSFGCISWALGFSAGRHDIDT